MKKALKISFIILLAVTMLFIITGCGKKEETVKTNEELSLVDEPKTDTNENVTNTSKSKTYNLFSKLKEDYVISLEGKEDLGNGEENVKMTLAKKGEKIYVDAEASSEHATIIYKDNTTYVLSHDEKIYMSMEGKNEESMNMGDFTILSEDELKEMEDTTYTEGKETIDGTEFDYEEYKDDDENVTERYYFAGTDLKYIKSIDEDGEEEVMKVNKISSEVDDSLFEIPEGYTKMSL